MARQKYILAIATLLGFLNCKYALAESEVRIIGEARLAVPSTWISKSNASANSLYLANLRDRKSITIRGKDVLLPKLHSLNIFRVPAGSGIENIQRLKKEVEDWSGIKKPDQYGFSEWQTGTHIHLSASWRPKDQLLVVRCYWVHCSSSFRWKDNVNVSYTFYFADIPKEKWTELDREVLAFLTTLEDLAK
jgi:hypothetical protein